MTSSDALIQYFYLVDKSTTKYEKILAIVKLSLESDTLKELAQQTVKDLCPEYQYVLDNLDKYKALI